MSRHDIDKRLFYFYVLKDLLQSYHDMHLSPDKLRQVQNKRLKVIARAAYETPIYRKKFDRSGLKPEDIQCKEDLTRLEPITKDEYRDWMFSERDSALKRGFETSRTSGTTGKPSINIFSPREYATSYAAYILGMVLGGKGKYNPITKKTLTRMPTDSSVGRNMLIQKLGLMRRELFDTNWDRERIIEAINRFQPDMIMCDNASMIYVGMYALEHNIEVFKPKFYTPVGENVDEMDYRILQKVFGDGLISCYGCSEMSSVAVRVPGEKVFHECESLAAVNVMRDDGSIVGYGTGSLLLTSLYRKEFPVLNYEVGDLADFQCVNGYDTIVRINSRKNDRFFWPDGTMSGWHQFSDVLKEIEEMEEVYQARFIQDTKQSIMIDIVRKPGSAVPYLEIEDRMKTGLCSVLPENTEIQFHWMKDIPPDSNGKLRMMVSKIEDSPSAR